LISHPAIFDHKVPAFNVAGWFKPRRRPVSRGASDSGDPKFKYPIAGHPLGLTPWRR
jgi:hypothetical protein